MQAGGAEGASGLRVAVVGAAMLGAKAAVLVGVRTGCEKPRRHRSQTPVLRKLRW